MRRIRSLGRSTFTAFVLLSLIIPSVKAQTSYPMLMSLKPVAIQQGQTSEVNLRARYSMRGADKVWISGKGVTGKITTQMTPVKKDKKGKPVALTTIKIKFTVDKNALLGVRDFRIVTPQGLSTLGQLVVVRDPVFVESKPNNTAETAEEVKLPATICGVSEKAEDVDFYKFHVDAGTSLSFHVRCMRLENRIHDLQTHADPIISLRNSSGTTLAASDNYFTGDPFLTHTFDQTGDYFLEIRDVRYKGNPYWEYSIEINDRPFITNIFPSGVQLGQPLTGELIGYHLPQQKTTTLNLTTGLSPGIHRVQLPIGKELSNTVSVVVSDVPTIVENDQPNNQVQQALPVTVPVGISGRVESESDIDCYAFEAKQGEHYSIEVIARRAGSSLDPIVRILDAKGNRRSENDDLKLGKRSSADSWLEYVKIPADGKYVVEVRDLHLRGGEDYVYFLKITRSKPYFELYLDTDKTHLAPGSHGIFFVNSVRKNGFQGEIQLQVKGLPPGVTASCSRILEGCRDGSVVLTASQNAQPNFSHVSVTGTAIHQVNEKEQITLNAHAKPYQEIYQPGGGRGHWLVEQHAVSIGTPGDVLNVKLSTNSLELTPGGTARVDIEIQRAEGFDKNVLLDIFFRHLNSVYGNSLPKGVTVDLKQSKTLLNGKENKGHITLKADAKAKPFEKQQIAVMANVSLNFVMKATYSSAPILVTLKPKSK